ncbi:MAG: ABC transporter ATP-binding protein [Burkholderiaceae bacterium]|jgi:multiple sugar transport system ATP-binding protein
MDSTKHLSLRGLTKRYGHQDVIRGVDLDIRKGEFLILVGPSGCGKSTLLRMIAGLEDISGGELLIDGKRMNEVHPADRGVAMVFQNYALYPHMTVAENMGFALKMAGVKQAERSKRVEETAAALRISNLLGRYPKHLSGGQRQRVAIGRSIVRKPQVFLFDEPLSNLDASLRTDMRIELARLHQELKTTMVYVTHDQVEAMTLGDRIAVLKEGKVEQLGPPLELYKSPSNLFVAEFLGTPKINVFNRPDASATEEYRQLWGALTVGRADASSARYAAVRPEHLILRSPGNGVSAKLAMAEHLGESTILHLEIDGLNELVRARTSDSVTPWTSGSMVSIDLDSTHTLLFDEASHGAH